MTHKTNNSQVKPQADHVNDEKTEDNPLKHTPYECRHAAIGEAGILRVNAYLCDPWAEPTIPVKLMRINV